MSIILCLSFKERSPGAAALPVTEQLLPPRPRPCFDGFSDAVAQRPVEAPPPCLCYDLQSLAANRRSENLFATTRCLHDDIRHVWMTRRRDD